jgi:hypothetical protein
VSFEQSEKQPVPKDVTDSGMFIDVSPEQKEKQ